MKTDLLTYLSLQLPLIEDRLKEQLIPLKSKTHPLLFKAAEHSLLNPGKRLRPLITLATTKSLGGEREEALGAACAIEILHTYSLIHDDLPCMDDDDLRRGRPTLHKLYPEGQAVLIGDLLLTLAFEVLAFDPLLEPEKILELIKVLSKRSGGKGMILGQSLDLASEGKRISWPELKEIHLRKTADLISASLEFGAIISGAPQSTRNVLASIGEDIGLSFQLIDDVLDVEGDPLLLGKPLLSDQENQKNTSVSLLGLKEARKLAEELLSNALKKCEDIGLKDSLLAELLPRLVYRSF